MTDRGTTQRSFGDWLRQRRRVLDLTQDELARRVGCSTITLRKLESENRRPSQQIAQRLADLLDVAPDDQASFLRFARGDPFAAPASAQIEPVDRQPGSPSNNLPHPFTSFIGREQACAAIKRLLAPPDAARSVRLMTLTGAGGSGKTRLAIEVAAELVDAMAFADGVSWVDLAPLSNPELVPASVAKALGLRPIASQPVIETLVGYLRSRALLLVLDNCEHLIDACAQLAQALLDRCSTLQLLATSRETLHLPGESVFSVSALSTPDADGLSSPETLLDYESVTLFVERALSIKRDLRFDGRALLSVAHICQLLDGIPLAIELAAARSSALTVHEIAGRLAARETFSLLTIGSRAARPRHQTLLAAIDWSYDMLTGPERSMFERLAVFAGGFTLPAVAAVCAERSGDTPALLDLLTQLVDKSLVVAETHAADTRYRLLETLREYALDRLVASGAFEVARQRHAAYYVALARIRLPLGPARLPWFDQLETEHPNLRAVLTWCQSTQGGAELALRGAWVPFDFWYDRGYVSEARGWYESALSLPEAANYPEAQAAALSRLALVFVHQGDYANARDRFSQALRLFEALGLRQDSAWALGHLGWQARENDDAATARRELEASLAICREYGYPAGIQFATTSLAEVAVMQDDPGLASVLLDEARLLARQLGDTNGEAWTLNHMGHVAQIQGHYELAARLHEESLAVFIQSGEQNLALVWCWQGLGETALAQGKLTVAAAYLTDALRRCREQGDRAGVSWNLAGLAGVAAADEEPERAARLWGAADSLRRSLGAREAPAAHATHERLKTAARAQLGAAAFEAAWAAGQTLTTEQAITYAQTRPS